MDNVNSDWAQTVLTFWFDELTKKEWFIANQKLDNTIINRFQPTHKQLRLWPGLPLDADEHKALAAVIVLDQFSRNMFRGTKKAFAFDEQALTLAKQALARELDQKLNDDEKQFLYMPFMHAENLDEQKTALNLFTAIERPEHAKEHLTIFEKFNRFPHRNKVLGRESTDQEINFLKDARRFGQ